MAEEYTQPLTDEKQIIDKVMADFRRAERYLGTWHKECNERYSHYRNGVIARRVEADKVFPSTLITEQVDMLVSDMMDKLWYRGEPCTLYPREETDANDAAAKQAFMEYQDDKDDLFGKVYLAIVHCALYGISPAVVNYKEETELQQVPQEMAMTYEDGTPQVDAMGQPITSQQIVPQEKIVYQGASTELVDIIDFFFTPEKRAVYDEHPLMIRTRRNLEWFQSKPYFLPGAYEKLKARFSEAQGGSESSEDLLSNRRASLGYGTDDASTKKDLISYVEWQGYCDLGSGRKLYIIGIAAGDILMRLDDANEVFALGKPNIVVGYIEPEFGEIRGASLVDKIHAWQHAQDSILGMWLKALRQTVNPMWIGNSNRMVTKTLVNEAGTFIDTMDDPDKVIKRVEQEQISQDIYKGLEMTRMFAQNASGMSDIASGVAQEGVETFGEANILASQGSVRVKKYLRNFEKSFIEPLWQMRNQINMRFVTDAGYIYSVIGDKVVFWRTITPDQVRADVDFVCEASNRENQRAVVTQQVLQAINLAGGLVQVLTPIPVVKLFEKLLTEGFGWKQDEVNAMLPIDVIGQNYAMQQMLQIQAAQGQGGKGKKENPQSMPQPQTETDAEQSAQQQFTPEVGAIG